MTPTTRAGGGGWHENLNRPDVETGGELRAVLHKRENSRYCRVIYCFYYGFTCYNGIMASPGHPGVTPSLLLLGVGRRGARHTSRGREESLFSFHTNSECFVELWCYNGDDIVS